MNSIATTMPFWSSTAEPPSVRTAGNGVQHFAAGSRPEVTDRGDVYELPSDTPGVPQQIIAVPRKWWGGGGKLEAVDCKGERLETKQWGDVVTVVQARTGVTTTLDRKSLDVTVSTEVLSKTRPMLSGARTISACKLQQSIKANGDIRVRTNYNAVEERVVYGMAREMPANCEMTVALDEDYEETLIPANGSARTAVMHKQRRQDPVETAVLSSRVDQSGDLVVTRPDGTEEITHLFIAPHALH